MRRFILSITLACVSLLAAAQDLELQLPLDNAPTQAAQEIRIGVLDIKAVFQALPETAQLQNQLDLLQATYQSELLKLEDEYQSKVSTFLADRDRLPQNIQDARIQEIDQLQLRVQAMRSEAAEDLEHKQTSLTEPLRIRVKEAIGNVCEQMGLAYVLDITSDAVLYVSPSRTVNIYNEVLEALNKK